MIMRRRSLALLVPSLLHVAGGSGASAQTAVAAEHTRAPSIRAVPAAAPIRVDGVLDETVWAMAPAATTFTQLVPTEGAPATERTEVRFAYDDEALYIGARMYDSAAPTTRLGRRDGSTAASDWLALIIDSHHDHRTAYSLEINPSGLRRDQTHSESGVDDSWDPVWQAATLIDDDGWTAELRIPFSQLRFSPAEVQTWGIQIERHIARNNEVAVFSFTPTSQPAGIPRFGHLEGLRQLQPGKRLELLPYTVLRGESIDRGDNPFRDKREARASLGADLKYRVTSHVTLDMAMNPDFGQVEVDPAQVNLSAIETRYTEKRPFFVEGLDIFSFGTGTGNNVFYSRRIGRAPQLMPGTEAVDVRDAARIVGAAKLSGRTDGGWSVGVLNALTGREGALYRDGGGIDQLATAEPLTNYFVGRLRRDSRAGRTVIGTMLTTVHRDLDSDVARGRLRSAAYSGGVDFSHEWAGRTWAVDGFVSGSHVRGSEDAIALAQRSPWRYFQRPDADHLDFDPTRTSLSGLSAQAMLQHRRGRHWRYHVLAATTTPQFEVNDIGFQVRGDRIDGEAGISYTEPRPGTRLRSWSVNGSVRAERNYAYEPITNHAGLGVRAQTLSYWTGSVSISYFGRVLDDRLTRGGPSSQRPPEVQLFANLSSDSRRTASATVRFGYFVDDAGGDFMRGGIGITLRPAPSWSLAFEPNLGRGRTVAQHIGAVADPTAAHSLGTRYLFASLDQTTFSLETRFDVTFTPNLSLQIYAQPFISSADFGAPAELSRPGAYSFSVYGVDVGETEAVPGGVRVFPQGRAGEAAAFTVADRDFTLRSLRGNAVLRWEYRPGSTIFLAWQQQRSSSLGTGVFDLGRDRDGLFGTRPDNVLVLKASYWFNP
jgi:hypothetical protein